MHSPPPRTSRFIPVTVSYIALETSKNVMAMGASGERSQNVNESESESVGCSRENRWHIQTRMTRGGTIYKRVSGWGTTDSAGAGALPPPGGSLGTLTRAWWRKSVLLAPGS